MKLFLFVLLCLFTATGILPGQIINVHVKGLVCPSCAIGIKKHLLKTDKVKTVKIDVNKQQTYIHTLKNATLTDKEINKSIINAGYEVIKIIRNSKNNEK